MLAEPFMNRVQPLRILPWLSSVVRVCPLSSRPSSSSSSLLDWWKSAHSWSLWTFPQLHSIGLPLCDRWWVTITVTKGISVRWRMQFMDYPMRSVSKVPIMLLFCNGFEGGELRSYCSMQWRSKSMLSPVANEHQHGGGGTIIQRMNESNDSNYGWALIFCKFWTWVVSSGQHVRQSGGWRT